MSATVYIEFDDGSSLAVEDVPDNVIDNIVDNHLHPYPFSHRV